MYKHCQTEKLRKEEIQQVISEDAIGRLSSEWSFTTSTRFLSLLSYPPLKTLDTTIRSSRRL